MTDGQIAALRNLAHKQAGQHVGWINIADAGSLSDMGFAQRSRQGWTLTPAGGTALSALGPEAAPPDVERPVFGRERRDAAPR